MTQDCCFGRSDKSVPVESENRRTFTLDLEAESSLLTSIEEADRGEAISGKSAWSGLLNRY